MKKITLMLVACVLAVMTTTQVSAQKIAAQAITEGLAKADADSENPKKGIKASTWMKRAEAYYDAGKEAVKTLYIGASLEAVKITYGNKPQKNVKVTIGGKEMDAHTYPYVTIYFVDDRVAAWKINKEVKKGAFEVALASYAKAVEIDPSVESKAQAGIDKITNHYREMGNIAISLELFPLAATSYIAANKALTTLDKTKADANLLYLAGYLYTIEGGKNKKAYTNGEKFLRAALAAGYNETVEPNDKSVTEEERGRIYYYIYHCVANGEAELTPKRLKNLKELLIKAIAEFPKNSNVMSALMNLYSSHPEIGSPEEVLEMIEKALATNPDNISVWYSRGRVYSEMKNYDECIKSFENVVRLDPEGFNGYFYLGMFYTSKADEYNDVMRNNTYTKQAEYDADFEKLCSKYKEALPFLEKAHSIKSTDKAALEYLKSIYFRLREEEGMMDLYNKYNSLYDSL